MGREKQKDDDDPFSFIWSLRTGLIWTHGRDLGPQNRHVSGPWILIGLERDGGLLRWRKMLKELGCLRPVLKTHAFFGVHLYCCAVFLKFNLPLAQIDIVLYIVKCNYSVCCSLRGIVHSFLRSRTAQLKGANQTCQNSRKALKQHRQLQCSVKQSSPFSTCFPNTCEYYLLTDPANRSTRGPSPALPAWSSWPKGHAT